MALAGLLHENTRGLEGERRIDEIALERRHVGGRFGAEIDALDVAWECQTVFLRQYAEHLLARSVGGRHRDARAIQTLHLLLDAQFLGARHQLVGRDDVVYRPVGDAIERDDALALHRDGQHVLVTEDTDVGLLGECCLQRERAALHVGNLGLQPVLLEYLLLLGDVERGGEIAMPDIGDFHRLGAGRARDQSEGHG